MYQGKYTATGTRRITGAKETQTTNIYFINLLYCTFQRHKAFIYISPKVIILYFFSIVKLALHLLLFFLLPSATGNPRSPSGRLSILPFIPIQSGPSTSSSEEQRMCQSKSSLQWLSCNSPSASKPFKKMHCRDYLFDNSNPGRPWGSFVLSPMHMHKERVLLVQGNRLAETL